MATIDGRGLDLAGYFARVLYLVRYGRKQWFFIDGFLTRFGTLGLTSGSFDTIQCNCTQGLYGFDDELAGSFDVWYAVCGSNLSGLFNFVEIWRVTATIYGLFLGYVMGTFWGSGELLKDAGRAIVGNFEIGGEICDRGGVNEVVGGYKDVAYAGTWDQLAT